jgi:hypothetical protein
MAHETDGPARREDGPDDVATREDEMRRAVLTLLVSSGWRWPWSLGELEAEIGNALAVGDAVRQLQGLGLVHRCQEFVWPTRATLAAEQLLR